MAVYSVSSIAQAPCSQTLGIFQQQRHDLGKPRFNSVILVKNVKLVSLNRKLERAIAIAKQTEPLRISDVFNNRTVKTLHNSGRLIG